MKSKALEVDKNFGLTQRQFDEMRTQLKGGNQELFKTVFLAHFEYAMNFLLHKYHLTRDDAYDCTMAALLDFRQKLVEEKIKYGNLAYLMTRMAANKYINLYHKRKVHKNDIELEHIKDMADLDDEEYEAFDATVIQVLKQAWEKLESSCQDLLKLHFYQAMRLTEIAEEWQVKEATLRKRKQRCMSALREEFKQLNKQ